MMSASLQLDPLLQLSFLHYICLGIAALAGYVLYSVYIWPLIFDPIRNLPGPPSKHWLIGNLEDVHIADRMLDLVAMQEHYGGAMRVPGLPGTSWVHLSDTAALNHVLLAHGYGYVKPKVISNVLLRILGQGLVVVEGDVHRRQRRLMAAPFGWANVKSYLPIFEKSAEQLVQCLDQLIDPEGEESDSWTVVEITNWLGRCFLDIMGKAGFDYNFQELAGSGNKLASAFTAMLAPMPINKLNILAMIVVGHWPWLTKLPTDMTRKVEAARRLVQAEAAKMLYERRKAAENGGLEDKTDLISILYRASQQSQNPKERLTDDEVMSSILTFVIAGYETTSLALTWLLRELSIRPAVQDRLRAEIRAAKQQAGEDGKTGLSADDIVALPYLDAVLRDSLRLNPSVPWSERQALKDDVIPLKTPITAKDGQTITAIPIKKGQLIHIGIMPFNVSKQIYGPDALEFRPERWLEGDLVAKVQGFPTFAPLLTFLGGPRGCIGIKFALLEAKTLLMALIDAFDFAPRDPNGTTILRTTRVVMRPVVTGEEETIGMGRLPLRIRRAK